MEKEAKFIVPDADVFTRLQALTGIGPYTRSEAKVKQVHDRYVDTADRRFYRQGFFARLRQVNGSLILTLKGLGAGVQGAVHQREEYETPVPSLEIATWPEGDVRQRAEAIAGDAPLSDLVALDQTRFVSILRQDERRVAEMSLDEITIGADGSPSHAYELEVELLPDGSDDDLRTLAGLFAGEYGLDPQPLSKFERALALGQVQVPAKKGATRAGKKRAPGIAPADSMATAARKILRVQTDALTDKESGARAGVDPEDVHDARVATRRMRAILRLADPYLQGAGYDRVARGARRAAHALGAVRDLDVLLAQARKFRDTLPADQQGDLDGLLAAWEGDVARARAALVALLDSRGYRRFKKRLDAFAGATEAPPPHTRSEVTPYEVRHVVGSLLWQHYETVRAYETVMDAPAIEQLHALRIEGKYLRYALEFFVEVLPADAATLIREVTAVQDQLGALHDAAVAADLIRGYVDGQGKRKHAAAPDMAGGLGAYLADRERAIQEIQAGFRPTWDTLISPPWRARLAAAVAAL